MYSLDLWDDMPTMTHVVVVSIVCLLLFVQYRTRSDPLRSIPGPFIARFSRLWMVWHSWNGTMHRTMIECHARYGKLVRTGPNEVSVSDPSAIKKIYAPGTKFVKSNWVKTCRSRYQN